MRGDGRGLITPLNADLKEGKAKGRQDLVDDGARDAEQGRDPEVEDVTDTWGWPVSGWERGKKVWPTRDIWADGLLRWC
jgi:hypothetical protein